MSYLYISNNDVLNPPLSYGEVVVFETGTNTVVSTIVAGSVPRALAITPDLTKVYVVNYSSSNVSVIDTTTNTVISTITVGSEPVSIA